MSENKALAFVAISIFIVALMLICLPPSAYGCMIPFAGAGLLYGFIAWYKHRQELSAPVLPRHEAKKAASQVVLPPMTSKGCNGRLFLPPGLHKEKD